MMAAANFTARRTLKLGDKTFHPGDQIPASAFADRVQGARQLLRSGWVTGSEDDLPSPKQAKQAKQAAPAPEPEPADEPTDEPEAPEADEPTDEPAPDTDESPAPAKKKSSSKK